MGDKEQSDQRIGLFSRRLEVGITDPTLLPRVEEDALLFLLPDDDPEFLEQEVSAAADSTRRGQNVHPHHVRSDDLPERPEPPRPIGAEPGPRRATDESETGGVLTNQILGILGEDGTRCDTDGPFPIPCDDEDDPFFRFRF